MMGAATAVTNVCDRCGSKYDAADYMRANEWGQLTLTWRGDKGGRSWQGDAGGINLAGKAWLCLKCVIEFEAFMSPQQDPRDAEIARLTAELAEARAANAAESAQAFVSLNSAKQEVQRLTAALAHERERGQWRRIESAPRDERILVPATKRMGMCVAMHHSRDGWVTETPSEWVPIYTPAHWRPLPPPPQQSAVQSEGEG